ncbi:MAG: hypothetical protein K9L64_04060 [Candidatus Izimaplasma sp.]|nr:hypothetical protein [Candidatus Izimaplasma bacterium]
MATYSKGYKKQNQQLLLIKVIVGIIVTVGLLMLAALVFDKATDWKDYNSYSHAKTYDEVWAMNDEDGNPVSNYAVYFYSNTCPTCRDIKEDVLGFANDYNKDSERFFLADINSITTKEVAEDETAYTKQNFLTEIGEESISTPMIVVVTDNQLEEVVLGKINIEEFLEALEQGTYEPFND